jgi:16S rRNA processing protein RimM
MALVGRVARAHGIKGQVIVNLETDFPEERFRPGARLFINRGGDIETLTITTARFHQGRPVIGIEGVADMNAAIALAGVELRVPRDWLPPLPAGTFYHHDLVGCEVETTDGAAIGRVSAVEGGTGGGGYRLVVETPHGELLIPLAAAICQAIDPTARRIVITPPDGLLELNRPARRGSATDAAG